MSSTDEHLLALCQKLAAATKSLQAQLLENQKTVEALISSGNLSRLPDDKSLSDGAPTEMESKPEVERGTPDSKDDVETPDSKDDVETPDSKDDVETPDSKDAGIKETPNDDVVIESHVVKDDGVIKALEEKSSRLEGMVAEYRNTCDALLDRHQSSMEEVKNALASKLLSVHQQLEEEKSNRERLFKENIALKRQVLEMREVMALALEKQREQEQAMEKYTTALRKENSVLRQALGSNDA